MSGAQIIKKISPHLIKERRKCTFNIEELTHLLDGGKENTEERRSKEKIFLEDPELRSKVPVECLSHKEQYEESTRIACKFFKKFQDNQWGMDTFSQKLWSHFVGSLIKDGTGFLIHYGVFIPALVGQGNAEQQTEWLMKAWNGSIIGTYAQTELGHGTFIRGLETTATYDPKTEEFVLNSPTLTAYKWWPGGLANTANHAVVVAQLYTQGKCQGIHQFIVQLRDQETHMPLPGIKLGGIGCKMGLNGVDNGYLGFDNVRIPRKNLLMKNNQVLPDGTYIASLNSKLTYGTMIFVRVMIVQNASMYLKSAVTIATRYSAVRHQSLIKPNEPEVQILDFLTQQHKLFPYISMSLAFQFAADSMWHIYSDITRELETGKLDNLPELHAIACALKAVSTADAMEAVEILRLSCGGHGYMTSSNLPRLYSLVTAACTYEGENTVLLLQTARYLIKSWQNKNNINKTRTLWYLGASTPRSYPFEKSVRWIISILQLTLREKLSLANQHINGHVAKGEPHEFAWNNTSIELASTAVLHGRTFIVETYYNTVNDLKNKTSRELGIVLQQLLELYAVHTILKSTGDVLRFTNVLGKDVEKLHLWLEELLTAIRPNAVGLVDSFDLHDETLSSTLGAYDGNVYERLFNEAQKSPLNNETVNKSFNLYLKPFMKSNM